MGSGRILILIAVSLISASEVFSHTLTCIDGWSRVSYDKCYKQFTNNDERMWRRAVEVCESYGSRLVSIEDQYENNELSEFVGNDTESYWIGLSNFNNYELQWHRGDKITTNQGFWGDGQPDFLSGECVYAAKNEEQYVYDMPYAWHFGHCNIIRSFVCERPAAPPGSFHCFNGGYVSDQHVCDGQVDCADSSDELDYASSQKCNASYCQQYRKDTGKISLEKFETCKWAIETPLGTNAYVKFNKVNMENDADFVHVYVGSFVEVNAVRVASLTGTGGNILQFHSHNNMMLIKFYPGSITNRNSDGNYVIEADYGFNAVEEQFVKLTATDGVQEYTTKTKVTGDGGLTLFAGSTDYVYVIKTERLWEIITVEIDSVELHDADLITFYDGDSPLAPVLSTICNTCRNYNTVFSTGRYLSIYLRTEREQTKDVVFSFKYKQGCSITTTDRYGVLFTPGFPGNVPYANFMTCTWVINSDKPFAIFFDKESMLQGITFGRVNNGDYLEIYENATSDTGIPLHGPTEGFTNAELAEMRFVSNSGKMFLRFTASPTRSIRGFLGNWSNGCEDPEYDENTLVSKQVQEADYYYKANNKLSCPRGYGFHQEQIAVGTSQVEVSCGYRGVWSYKQIPRCTKQYCGNIPNMTNGYILSSTGSTYESVATYKCFPGSKLVPSRGSMETQITCQSNGTWSPPPTCESGGCTFSDIAMTGFHLTGNLRHGDGTAIGSIVDYTCDAGYELVGEPILFCQADGTWSNPTPSCNIVECFVPALENGGFLKNGGFINFGETKTSFCNSGYTFANAAINSVTCQGDRSLTELPSCINVDDCAQSPCVGGDCVDTDGSFYCMCPTGYQLASNQLGCLDIDECHQQENDCDQLCHNDVGSYACSCDPGYTLYTADGTSGYSIPLPSEDGSLPTDTYHINHTCVLIECPPPTAIVNGQLLTNRAHHRYGDQIEYHCDLGYIAKSTVLTCLSDGTWSGSAPTCGAATCPTENPTPGLNPATFAPGPYAYNISVDLNCSVGTSNYTKQRHCVYDKRSDEYRLLGAEYDCRVIDCGQPDAVPGSAYNPVAHTVYPASFEFVCDENRDASGQSGAGNTTVYCDEDGFWNFGNLQCFELACMDPGVPAGGDIIATDFADKSEITFNCTHPGYELSHSQSMRCQGTTWVGTVPTCEDKEFPVLQDFDKVQPIVIERYELLAPQLESLRLKLSDNTAIKTFTISPSNANSTLVVENDGTVVYTAVDYAGNAFEGVVNYHVKDEIPPTVTCPLLKQIYFLDDTDTETYTISDRLFSINDNSGEIKSIEVVSRPQETFTMADVHKTFTYTVRVKDNSDNVATCKAQIFVTVRECSPLAYPTPLNANKTCTDSLQDVSGRRAYSCIIQCQEFYTFPDGKEKTVTCDTNKHSGAWTNSGGDVIDWSPACVKDVTPPAILSCPSSEDVFITVKQSSVLVDFSAHRPQIADWNDVASIKLSVDAFTFTYASMYEPYNIDVTVTDNANNTATCTYQYMAKPVICSPLSYPNVLNAGEPSCTRRPASSGINPGYDCTITADPGYILRAHGQNTTVSCDDGSAWDEIIPAAIVDTTPPTVICPKSRTILLATDTDEVVFTMANIDFTVTDIGGVNNTKGPSFTPPLLNLTVADLYNTHRVVLSAHDLRGNEGSCDFYISVMPLPCSPLSLPILRNGQKTCKSVGGGYNCTLSCDPNYEFDFTEDNEVTLSCANNQSWTQVVTSCTPNRDATSTTHVEEYKYSYKPTDTSTEIDVICDKHYTEMQFAVFDAMEFKMFNACRAPIKLDLNVTFFPEMVVEIGNDDANRTNRQVNITYKFKMTSPRKDLIISCSGILEFSLPVADDFPFAKPIPSDSHGTCPNLTWIPSKAARVSSANVCFKPKYKSVSNPSSCLHCPPGSVSDSIKCDQCRIGDYKSNITSDVCESCPTGTSTRYPGSTSVDDCVAKCPAGSYSDTGIVPCFKCPVGSYSDTAGLMSCTACSDGKTTDGTGSDSSSQCVEAGSVNQEQCSLGTEPVGDGTCRLCPLGWYRSANSDQCIRCPLPSTSTYVTGAVSSSQCHELCRSGMTSDSGLPPCTACPKGTYWYNSSTCVQCRANFTTSGIGASNIADCVPEASLRAACPRGMKRDGDACVNCPVGEYQDTENQASCKPCTTAMSTYTTGATSESMCFYQCDSGFWSASGLSPCAPCGVGSYSLNATTCEPCGSGKTTATNTAGSVSECIDQCTLGQFSYSGYNFGGSCRNCPANYYQDGLGRTDCRRCPSSTTYSTDTGLSDITLCRNASVLCNASRCTNGGTCVIQDNTYLCECPKGYYGIDCEYEVGYCNSNPCYNGGTCSETRDGHSCDCGGFATGSNCEQLIQTCHKDTCDNNGDCVNRPGYTECLCRPGFAGLTCNIRQDICSLEPCMNGGTCSDTSFGENKYRKCTCPVGFSGKDCEMNIDDCEAPDTCLNDGNCSDRTNDYFCACPPGYGGKYCQNRADRCIDVDCGHEGICVDDYTVDLPRCICQPGYQYGKYDQYGIAVNQAPSDIGSSPGTPGATIDICRDTCDVLLVNQCDCFTYNTHTSTCHIWSNCNQLPMISTDSHNTYYRDGVYADDDFWSPWYNVNSPAQSGGNDIENRDHLNTNYDLNICGGTVPLGAECRRVDGLPNQAGITCNADGLACSFGVCADYEVRFKCAAHRVYISNQCTPRTDYCDMSPCQHAGTCSLLTGGYSCNCTDGYTGKNCQTDIDDCAANPCANGGTCEDLLLGIRCTCQPGWTGKTCVDRVTYCQDNQVTCSGNGQCENPPDLADYFCDCYPGYTGHDCETVVDNCESSPCIHGGHCSTRAGDYDCICVPGYTGKNCESVTDSCPTLGAACTAPGTCHNIFDNYYCVCPPNTYGDNCENQPSPCANYNKCLNGGTCTMRADTTMQCSCPSEYQGEWCEELVNHCGHTNYCQNGGICTVTSNTAGYMCHCSPGYEGTNCERVTSHCVQGICPGGTCDNEVGKYVCRCPLGKTGTDCAREFDRDYDLFFHHPYGLAFAWLPVWTLLENPTAMSVSLWVRYTQNKGTGIYLTMFIGDQLQQSSKFLEFMHDGIKVYVQYGLKGDHMKLLYTHNFVLNDGNWHNVVFNYDMVTGRAYLVADSISHTEIQNDRLQRSDSFKFWSVLGCEFEQAKHECVKGEHIFLGLLSQITWYNRMLHTTEDIPQLMLIDGRQLIFSENTQFSDVLLVWNGYQPESGVNRIIPSEAGKWQCDDQQRMLSSSKLPACLLFIAREHPRFIGCPEVLIQYSPSRTTSVSWDEIEVVNAVRVNGPHYHSGGIYNWGKYSIIYTAEAANTNKALCYFKVHVQRNQCDDPSEPSSGKHTVVDDNPINYKGIHMVCLNDTVVHRAIDRPAPELFTCAHSGSWNVKKPYDRFRYPSCGEIKNTARVRIEVDIDYEIATSHCEAFKTNANARITVEFTNMNNETRNRLCTEADCKDIETNVNCNFQQRRKRAVGTYSTHMNMVIPSAERSVSWDDEVLTMEQYVIYYILGADILDFSSSIPNGNIVPRTLVVRTTYICPEGQVFLGGDCVECGSGNYYRDIGGRNRCHDCPLGQYQDQSGMASCKPCDSDKTTEMTGSYRATDCKKKCPAGQYYDNTAGGCLECGLGFYQAAEGKFYCDFCGSGETTNVTGSTRPGNCIEMCLDGEQLLPSGICEKCPIGQYRKRLEHQLCQTCPTGLITATVGATSAADCTVTACGIGTHLDNATNQCIACPRGTYQDTKWQWQCKLCGDPANWSTDEVGATNQTQCKYYCPSGFEVRDVGVCDICTVGYYKDNTVDIFGVCVPCGGELITPSNGSISSENCTILACDAGKYLDKTGTPVCMNCPYDTYQPDNLFQQERCDNCPAGRVTLTTGSSSVDHCVANCTSGQEYNRSSDSCQLCEVGFYRGQFDHKQMVCQPCPVDKITPSRGSTSVADCSIGTCNIGEEFDGPTKTCVDCSVGYYQPAAGQMTCIQCPEDVGFTARTGATSSEECFSPCDDDALNECSVNATCTPNWTHTVGYECVCSTHYIDNNPDQPGRLCTHTCDMGYCKNGGQCLREPALSCECTEYYEGSMCEVRIDAETAEDSWKDIVIPVGIALGALLLIIMALVLYCRARVSQKVSTDEVSQVKEDTLRSSMRSSTLNYKLYPMMASMDEVQFENPAYIGARRNSDPAIYQA